MRRYWPCSVGFLLFFHSPLWSQSGKPLATEYVECVRNGRGVDVASRKLQTPIFESKKGGRAFGIASAQIVAGQGCQNETMLYVAEPHNSFRLVFQQGPERNPDSSIFDGNGIGTIRWSPAGRRVLAEISQWIWASDSGVSTKYVLFTSGDRNAKQISPDEALRRQFKQPCGMDLHTTAWIDDDHIELVVTPFTWIDVEGLTDPTPSCVKEPMKFSFDVESGNLTRLPDKDP